MKLAYFTGGTAGAGHLVRGLAISRALDRAGYSGDMRMFIPAEPMPGLQAAFETCPYAVCPIDPAEVLDPVAAPESALAAALIDYAPDLLLVDMFWAPVLHILPRAGCESWLLVRSCPENWLRGTETTRFEPLQYARVIGIEPLAVDGIREHISPIVVCNPDDAKTREEVCAHWGIEEGQRIVAITHAGLQGEIDTLQTDYDDAVVDDARESFIIESDLYDRGAVFPLAAWLPGVDQVHCMAGYNSYWESRWMNYAHKTRLRVVARQIDSPLHRVKAGESYRLQDNGADVLAKAIAG
jgi:hypothetical protein